MSAPAAAGAVAPPAERGAVTVADRAVRRIAGRAAGEAVGPGGSARAASAHVHGGRARVAVEVALPFPVDAAAVTGRVQRHVLDRTRELTGLTVSRADVLVDRLTPASGSRLEPRVTSFQAVGAPRPAGPARQHAPGRPWSPRGAPAALLAAATAGGCLLGLYLAAVGALGVPASPVSDLAGRLAERGAEARVFDAAAFSGAVTLAVLGLWLLLLALTPGARRRLRLVSPDGEVRAVLDRPSVALLLRDTAMGVPGIASARVRTGRRRARVRATVAFGDPADTRAALTDALTARRDALGLARPPRLRVRVTPSRSWHPPHTDGDASRPPVDDRTEAVDAGTADAGETRAPAPAGEGGRDVDGEGEAAP